jgi:glycosyltransferase involved in cell wall biosynthesis
MCGPCSFEVIPNGYKLPPHRRRRRNRGHFELLTVGRLVASKGHIHLLEAIRRLSFRRGDFRLSIVGDGEVRASLEHFVDKNRLRRWVRFEGFRKDIPSFLRRCDLFVLPTQLEGMSNALLEAAAYGLPIVTSQIPENEFIFDHGKSAWMVPPADPLALRRAIEFLMDAPHLRQQLGCAAYKRASNFTIEEMVKRHQRLYREVA